MNPWIKLIDHETVRIIDETDAMVCWLRCGKSHGFELGPLRTGDREVIKALHDCVHCYLDTGDFAALADTSAVPYSGKRMRVRCSGGTSGVFVVRRAGSADSWEARSESGLPGVLSVSAEDLLPLSETKPLRRPMTSHEALDQCGREFRVHGDAAMLRIDSVSNGCVLTAQGARRYTFGQLAEACTWYDTSTPCSVLIEEQR